MCENCEGCSAEESYWYQRGPELTRVWISAVKYIRLENDQPDGHRIDFYDHKGNKQESIKCQTEEGAKQMYGIIATKLCGSISG